MSENQHISVFGLGYIGLPTAAILADSGFNVHGIEIRQDAIDLINSGRIHISEEGLGELVATAVRDGRLRASSRPAAADVHIIAVPTPITSDKKPDLTYIRSAVRALSTVLKAGDLVVVESTSPPRTCLDVVAPLIEELTGLSHETDYDLAYCPERVIPGNILTEIVHNDRIIGGTTPRATKRTAQLYASFVQGELLQTDATTAEMCKLMENTYRDVNIALANELSQIAGTMGVDVNEAITLANHHPRVNIHRPGIGVGGHCIPVDPWFLLNGDIDDNQLIRRARLINDGQPAVTAALIIEAIKKYPKQPITFLGLTYKPDTDDFRESPAVQVAALVSTALKGHELFITDPFLTAVPDALINRGIQLLATTGLEHQPGLMIELVPHSFFASATFHKDAILLRNHERWRVPDIAMQAVG